MSIYYGEYLTYKTNYLKNVFDFDSSIILTSARKQFKNKNNEIIGKLMNKLMK